MKYIVILILAFSTYLSIHLNEVSHDPSEQSVYEVEISLGADESPFLPDFSMEGVSAEIGEDIIHFGFSNREGQKKSKRQSKHFVCTSCHNTVIEDPNLKVSDPEDRLLYTAKQGIPFLQATTLYGAVNRSTFYNDDYVKKYGELVEPARHDLRKAIQLCATECAQGRKLKEWEVESILAYLWKIDLKMADLNFSQQEYDYLESTVAKGGDTDQMLNIVRGLYQSGSPATFSKPPNDRKLGYGLTGNATNGQLIYETSCQHCHYRQKYSYLNLDDSKLTYDWLAGKAGSYSRYSIYQVIRYGTYPMHGKKSYMPLYTKEKMSDQQIEDLRAYLALKAG